MSAKRLTVAALERLEEAADGDEELLSAEQRFYGLIGRLADQDLQAAAELDAAAGAWLTAWVRLAWADGRAHPPSGGKRGAT